MKAGGEGDNRGWDGWMASLTRWTWVWVDSGSWWWTGRLGVLQFMGLQRAGHDRATELNWKLYVSPSHSLVFLLVSGGFVAMSLLSCWYWQLGCFLNLVRAHWRFVNFMDPLKGLAFGFTDVLYCVSISSFIGFIPFFQLCFISSSFSSLNNTDLNGVGPFRLRSFPPHYSLTRSSTGCVYRGRTWADKGTWAPMDFGAWGGPGTDSHGHQQPTACCFSYHLNI